jgi:hypothetical protein
MTITLTVWLMLFPAVTMQGDACETLIPVSLKAMIDKAYPGYRPPLVTDNLAEDVDWRVKQGGSRCLGVAAADFDGDARPDLAIALTARRADAALVVVALARRQRWALHTLEAWPERRSLLYVAADGPGVYRRTPVLDGPLGPGEVDPLRCSTSVVVFGQTESSGVAYCFGRGKWQHVWISD